MNLSEKINNTYKNKTDQAVFENSIDCLIYGYGFDYVNTLDLPKDKAKMIFKKAIKFLTDN